MSFVTQKPIKARAVPTIPPVGAEYYENILNMYQSPNEGAYYYFNISKRANFDISNVDEEFIEYFYLDAPTPLTTLSYRIFGTQHMWWLIVIMNKLNPLDIPPGGTVIVVPKIQYISNILQTIKQ